MKTVYVYILDTLADWELGHVLAELNSRRFFKTGAPEVKLVHVGASLEPVVSMGGISMTPAAVVDEIAVNEDSLLLLPGADTWSEPKNASVIAKAGELLQAGGDRRCNLWRHRRPCASRLVGYPAAYQQWERFSGDVRADVQGDCMLRRYASGFRRRPDNRWGDGVRSLDETHS